MKRTISVAGLLCCAWAATAHAASMTFVMEHFPPFNAEEKGAAVGPFPDTVRAVCASLKIECTIEIYPWRRAYRLAEEGQVDGIFVLQKLPEREKDFYFTDPVIQTSFAVFARMEARFFYATPHDLDGLTIGSYGPSATSRAAEDIMQSATNAKLVSEVDNVTVLRKLSVARYGERGVAVINADVGKYLIKQENIAGVAPAGEIKRVDYGIGLSKKKLTQKQAEQFNAALRKLIHNGTIKSIVEKYGMTPARAQ